MAIDFSIELEFLNDNYALIENKDFAQLYKKTRLRGVNWSKCIQILTSKEVHEDICANMTEIPYGFFNFIELPELDLVIPATVSKVSSMFSRSTFRSIKFLNPDCEVAFVCTTVEKLELPANISLGAVTSSGVEYSGQPILYDVNGIVVIPDGVTAIGAGAIAGKSPDLILNISKSHWPAWSAEATKDPNNWQHNLVKSTNRKNFIHVRP